MARLEDLDLDPAPKDDRWTLDKLRRAGYDLEWSRTCRTCGDAIEGYRHGATHQMLILDEAVLSLHQCEGR